MWWPVLCYSLSPRILYLSWLLQEGMLLIRIWNCSWSLRFQDKPLVSTSQGKEKNNWRILLLTLRPGSLLKQCLLLNYSWFMFIYGKYLIGVERWLIFISSSLAKKRCFVFHLLTLTCLQWPFFFPYSLHPYLVFLKQHCMAVTSPQRLLMVCKRKWLSSLGIAVFFRDGLKKNCFGMDE